MKGDNATFRPDIDGLRAVAVLLVVLYHAHAPGFDAGFIGVDVFFVISGFLITRLLLIELRRTGSIALAEFWARRARRLLPSAAVVTIATLGASWIFLSPLQWEAVGKAAVASSLYASNLWFAKEATLYFGSDVTASPLLHTWSLAVEEQFYIAWPLLLIAVYRWRRSPRLVTVALALMALASFLTCIFFTHRGSTWAFFGAPFRVWEFGLGAIVAVDDLRTGRSRRWAAPLAAGLGVFLLLAALVLIDEATPFPGAVAALPVLATALLIRAGRSGDGGAVTVMSVTWLQWIGRRSYAWYLWHWPFLVFAGVATTDPSLAVRLGAAGASLFAAALSFHLVENPIRFHRSLAGSARASLVMAVATILIGCTLGTLHWITYRLKARTPQVAAVLAARRDRGSVLGCETTNVDVLKQSCRFGDVNGERVALVIGDSHAMQWMPGLEAAARAEGVQIVFSGMSACPAIPVSVLVKKATLVRNERCAAWQSTLLSMVDALRPTVVITSNFSGYVSRRWLLDEHDRRLSEDQALATWQASTTAFATALERRGIELVVIADVPILDRDPVDCLARGLTPETCQERVAARTSPTFQVRDAERAAMTGHGRFVDVVAGLCDRRCPLVVDGVYVYRDEDHITQAFSRTRIAALAELLSPAAPR